MSRDASAAKLVRMHTTASSMEREVALMPNNYASIHQVSDGEDSRNVMTIAQLRLLINSTAYTNDTIVMFSRDLKEERQITGFVTAVDYETGKPYLVLTSNDDAQTCDVCETVDKPALAIVADTEEPCEICRRRTRFYDELAEHHFCSKQCQDKWYKLVERCMQPPREIELPPKRKREREFTIER